MNLKEELNKLDPVESDELSNVIVDVIEEVGFLEKLKGVSDEGIKILLGKVHMRINSRLGRLEETKKRFKTVLENKIKKVLKEVLFKEETDLSSHGEGYRLIYTSPPILVKFKDNEAWSNHPPSSEEEKKMIKINQVLMNHFPDENHPGELYDVVDLPWTLEQAEYLSNELFKIGIGTKIIRDPGVRENWASPDYEMALTRNKTKKSNH